MRKLLVGIVCAAAMAVPSVSSAQQQEGWSYAYTDGVATATQRDNRGRVTATLTCRPPTGDIVVTDYTLARNARNARTAAVRIGVMSVNVPMTLEGRGRNRTVVINLPQRPPILAAVQPNDRLSVTVNNQTVTYLEGGPARMREVAYGCWGS
ncbi:hypothetical protein [Candidatus Viadribacter manganicus]|uniref:Uncharacterized protein n=1 Tax=Candidatus Viadribacter manganicus TaxID=1759059 RepID=A0A1B1ALT8_9PROT|nr:hypothetical protein [Candidatus Viadribacter manganicus]ANP47526.1 hypothetical protein ATE48_17260 [Candidatus Viadribacter manganicus]